MNTIDLRAVSFAYRGQGGKAALKDITFAVGPGITGVVGPNGAGKSTLLRLLAGLHLPQHGTVLVNGAPPEALRVSGRVGLIPETPIFDDYLTVGEFVTGLTRLLRARNAHWPQLEEIWNQSLGALSLGQKRRVELTAALIGDPDLLLLDEPTNGLDPFALAQLRETIAGLSDGRRTIVVSSHHLDELQRTADRLLVVAAGRCRGWWERAAVVREFGSVEGLFTAVLGDLSAPDPAC